MSEVWGNNNKAFRNLIGLIQGSVDIVNGQDMSGYDIGHRAQDLFPRALMDMAGIEGVSWDKPEHFNMETSQKYPDTMYLNVTGLSENEVHSFVKSLNGMFENEGVAGKAEIVPADGTSGYDYSIKLPISGMQKLVPMVDSHLDSFIDMGSPPENPVEDTLDKTQEQPEVNEPGTKIGNPGPSFSP